MENKPVQNKFKIYEDQTQLQEFVAPEWIRIIKDFLENKNRIMEVKHR